MTEKGKTLPRQKPKQKNEKGEESPASEQPNKRRPDPNIRKMPTTPR